MGDRTKSEQPSVFKKEGFSKVLNEAKEEIKLLYQDDEIPWVIGYSGGKDSTAILQLVWLALSELAPEERMKPIHVISTDTLVENPVVAAWVNASLDQIQNAARAENVPIIPHRLTPAIEDTFWVNLIGKGYPAPRNKFRWCTLRLKINPSNNFIRDVVKDNGEAILVLGTRKLESSRRAGHMAKHEKFAVRERLTPNANLSNSLVYTPIEDWSNDDVWLFLMRVSNPWGYNNKDLMGMYRGASADGECPLVLDTSTPSCGSSRFGCWVCTLVDEDKSMAAMIQNDSEKEWMIPLLELRNELDFQSFQTRKRDRGRRDFRRLNCSLTYYKNSEGEFQLVHGPYTQETRAHWLRRLLDIQKWIHENGPDYVKDIDFITLEELEEIRRIWVVDKHEIEDILPDIYERVTGESYPGLALNEDVLFDKETLGVLKEACGNDLRYELARNLLDIEQRYRTQTRRRGLFKALEDQIVKCFYDNEQDALDRARKLYTSKQGSFVSDDGREIRPEGTIEIRDIETPKKGKYKKGTKSLPLFDQADAGK